MSKPLIQIGDEVREMTDVEFAQWEADAATHTAQVAAAETEAKARSSALAKLADLGLTKAEISALVG